MAIGHLHAQALQLFELVQFLPIGSVKHMFGDVKDARPDESNAGASLEKVTFASKYVHMELANESNRRVHPVELVRKQCSDA